MKVLVLTQSLGGGSGWKRYSQELVAELEQQGIEVLCAVQICNSTISTPQIALLSGIWSSFRPWSLYRVGRQLSHLVETFHPDIIHVFVEPYLIYGAFVSWIKSIPLVLTVHGTYADPSTRATAVKRVFVRWLFSRALGQCRSVIAVSQFTKRYFISRWPAFARITSVIYSGGTSLSSSLYTSGSESFPEPAVPTFLMIGELKERRGQLEAVQAFALVKRSHPDARLILVGSSREREYIERVQAEIEKSNLMDALLWIRERVSEAELRRLYMTCTILLAPSKNIDGSFEGFGLVALEANAFGKPVIGSRDCGLEEAIQPGLSGFLVPQNNPAALAEAMLRALEYPWEPAQIKAYAAAFSWKKTAHEVKEGYDTLVA